jgi:hypothetical protein
MNHASFGLSVVPSQHTFGISIVQTEEHPSPLIRFPSSHVSLNHASFGVSVVPSQHTFGGSIVHVDEHPSALIRFPSSHFSLNPESFGVSSDPSQHTFGAINIVHVFEHHPVPHEVLVISFGSHCSYAQSFTPSPHQVTLKY